MAEGGGDLFSLSVQKLDEELTCPVCHEHFEEPKVLPCLHCYCKKCVAALISRTPRGQPINCPECRRSVQVEGNDPESLPTAFFVNRMEAVFSVMKKAEKKEEVICESCSRQSSIAFCKNCRHYICDRCAESHKLMSIFSNHEVISIPSLLKHFKKSGASRVPIEAQELKCHKHTNEPLKLYCYTCHQLVCRDCTLIDHKDHKYAFIVDAIPRCKSTIKVKVESLQNLSCGLKTASKLLTESEKKLKDHNAATIKAIDDAHNRIVLKLQQKSKELKAATAKMINSSQEKIASQKKNIDLAVGEVDSLYDFLSRNLERATDQELFSLLKQMSDQAERAAQLYADPPSKFPVPTPPQLEVHCSNRVLQVLQEEFSVSEKGLGQATSYQPQGQATSYQPQGQATAYQPQGQATTNQPQGQATSYQPHGQATTNQPQGQATSYQPHGQATSYPTQDQASYHPSQGQAHYHPSQGQAHYHPFQGQTSNHPSQGQASYHPSQGQASYHPSQGQAFYYLSPGLTTSYSSANPTSSQSNVPLRVQHTSFDHPQPGAQGMPLSSVPPSVEPATSKPSSFDPKTPLRPSSFNTTTTLEAAWTNPVASQATSSMQHSGANTHPTPPPTTTVSEILTTPPSSPGTAKPLTHSTSLPGPQDTPPDEEMTTLFPNLNGDALALLKRLPEGDIPGVEYNVRDGLVRILLEKKSEIYKAITKFQAAYKKVALSNDRRLRVECVDVPEAITRQEVEAQIAKFEQRYKFCAFVSVEEKRQIKVISQARQFEQAKKFFLKALQQSAVAQSASPANAMVLTLPSNRKLTLKMSNIVEEETEAIVNATSRDLLLCSGVAGALNAASQGQQQTYCDQYMVNKGKGAEIPVGEVVVAHGGGSLKCKHVIHAVGPESYRHSDKESKRLIKVAIENALRAAEARNMASIAIPALSCGSFGVNKELVAQVITDTILGFHFTKLLPTLTDIRIVIIDEPTHSCFARYFSQKAHTPFSNRQRRL